MPPKTKPKPKKTKKPRTKNTIEQKQNVKQTVKVVIGEILKKTRKPRKPQEKKVEPPPPKTVSTQLQPSAQPIPINRLDPNQAYHQNAQFDKIKQLITDTLRTKTRTENLIAQQEGEQADLAQIQTIPPLDPQFISIQPLEPGTPTSIGSIEPLDLGPPASTTAPPSPVQEPATIQPPSPMIDIQQPVSFKSSSNFTETQSPIQSASLLLPAAEPEEELGLLPEPPAESEDTDEERGGGPKIPASQQFEIDLSDIGNFMTTRGRAPEAEAPDSQEKKLFNKLQRFKTNYTLKKGAVMRLKKYREVYEKFAKQYTDLGIDYPFYITEEEMSLKNEPETPPSRGRKERSDKGGSRGPSLRTASIEALQRGYALVAVKTAEEPKKEEMVLVSSSEKSKSKK